MISKEKTIDMLKKMFKNGNCSHYRLDFNQDGTIKRSFSGKDLHICNNIENCINCKMSIKSLEDVKKLITKSYTANTINKKKYILNYLFGQYIHFYITEEIVENMLKIIFSLKDEDLEEKKEIPVIDKEDKTWSIEINGENPCRSTHINDVLSSYFDNVEGIRAGRQWNIEVD